MIVFYFLSICVINPLYAQVSGCDCRTEIEFLDSKIRKSAPYKNNKENYQEAYNLLKIDGIQDGSSYDCYEAMVHLSLSLNDAHTRIYGLKPDTSDYHLINHPIFEGDIDSLLHQLKLKLAHEKEGVYHNEEGFKIGVHHLKSKNIYESVVIESPSELWRPGEILYRHIPYGNDFLLTYGGQLSTRRYISFTGRMKNGTMLRAGFAKAAITSDFSHALHPSSTYKREEISDEISYLKLGSFNSFYPTLSDAEKFYADIRDSLTKKHLIVDLRDNFGGGKRNSDIILKILQKYMKKNRVYLISNHNTSSNAEQFILKLKKNDNVVLVGERTSGTLSYEIKNSTHTLPCSETVAQLTSKTHKKYLPYETQGIEPDRYLDYTHSWVEQIISIIHKNP